MKKIFKYGCLLLLCAVCMQESKAQSSPDFGLWTGVEVEKKLWKGWEACLEGEFRSRNNVKTVDRWSASAQMSYKITKWLKASAGYSFYYYYHPMEVTGKGNYVPEYWQPKHRVNVSLTGDYDITKRLKVSLRERWQYTYRAQQEVEKYDGYDGSRMDDEVVKGKGKNNLRSRLQVEYDIKNCPLSPYISCELTHEMKDGFNYEKTRYMAGTEWKINKKHALDVYYLYQNHDDDDDEVDGHVMGVKYKLKLK